MKTTTAPPPPVAPHRTTARHGGVGAALRRNQRWLVITAIAGLGVLLPFMVNGYWLSTAVFVLIAAIGALGLDLLTGRTGQISLGHAFFLGVGAYTGGVLGGRYGLSAALSIPAAAVVAGLLGGLVGPTALRLRGLYLAIVTIGLIFIGQHVFVNVVYLSGGPGGEALPVPTFGGVNFARGVHVGRLFINRDGLFYYLALVLLAAAMAYVHNLGRSRHGRSMYAVRDRELAAAVLGVDVARTKVMAFVLSSMLAGVSGALVRVLSWICRADAVEPDTVHRVRGDDRRGRYGDGVGPGARRSVRHRTAGMAAERVQFAALPQPPAPTPTASSPSPTPRRSSTGSF